MEIRKLTLSDQAAYIDLQRKLEAEDNEFVGQHTKEVPQDFSAFLAELEQLENQPTNPNYSEQTQYFAFIDGAIAGRISCRWQLEKGNLATIGGHIGYATSPAFRRRGVASHLLTFAIKEYEKRGIRSILITAREDNLASRKTIERAGGRLENILDLGDGHRLARYWIDLDEVS